MSTLFIRFLFVNFMVALSIFKELQQSFRDLQGLFTPYLIQKCHNDKWMTVLVTSFKNWNNTTFKMKIAAELITVELGSGTVILSSDWRIGGSIPDQWD